MKYYSWQISFGASIFVFLSQNFSLPTGVANFVFQFLKCQFSDRSYSVSITSSEIIWKKSRENFNRGHIIRKNLKNVFTIPLNCLQLFNRTKRRRNIKGFGELNILGKNLRYFTRLETKLLHHHEWHKLSFKHCKLIRTIFSVEFVSLDFDQEIYS